MIKRIFIRHRTAHHAGPSGYGRILDRVDDLVFSGETNILPYTLARRIASYVDQRKGIYNSTSVQKDIALASIMLSHKKGLVHYLNAERDIRVSIYLRKWRNWQFSATFHKPPEVLLNQISDFKYLSRLDAAIAVGVNQLDFLKDHIGIPRVDYIPHGVDTDFFYPRNEPFKPGVCLFVGQHLRDFETLQRAFPELEKLPGFHLNVVVMPSFVHLLPKSPRITLYNGITDIQLRQLYQEAALLLLPLKNVTACNSILEAMACGLPVVTTDLEANRNYLNNECGILTPAGNAEKMVEAVAYLLEDEKANCSMRQASRERGLTYSWVNIQSSFNDFIDSFC